jgi:hypothetical protein
VQSTAKAPIVLAQRTVVHVWSVGLIMSHDVENLFSIHCLLPDVVNLWVHG